MTDQSLYQQFLDAIVVFRLEQLGEIDRDWLAAPARLDYDRLPDHIRGPVDRIHANTEGLVDVLMGILRGRNEETPPAEAGGASPIQGR